MDTIQLNFKGPYIFNEGDRSVFHCPYANSEGIYLWTIKQNTDNAHLIHYVGETTGLASRHRDHLIHILGLNYGIFDPNKAKDGIAETVWDGLWRNKTEDGPGLQIDAYKQITQTVIQYISVINIFFAELVAETYLRKHIEGCIGWNLRNKYPKYKVLYPDDNRIGTKSQKTIGELHITSSEKIHGLNTCIKY